MISIRITTEQLSDIKHQITVLVFPIAYHIKISLSPSLLNSIMGGNGYYMADNARAVLSCITVPGGDAGIQYAYRNNLVATRQYWTPDNGVTNAPALYFLPRRVVGIYQDRSFVRLQDVSLSYNFGKSILSTLGVDGLQVYVSGKNLHTWTKWQGWDSGNDG